MDGFLVIATGRSGWPVVGVNDGVGEQTGFAAADLLERAWPPLWDPDREWEPLAALSRAVLRRGPATVALPTLRADGSAFDSLVECFALRDAAELVACAIRSAADARDAAAFEDPLTGCATRSSFERDLSRAISRAERERSSVAVLFLDLDRFKEVNDRFGHAVGDEVLREAGRRMRRGVRAHDIVARMGGDEFVVSMTDLREDTGATTAAAVTAAAGQLRRALLEPMELSVGRVEVGVSIGAALYPDQAGDGPGLLAIADARMYRFKREGRMRALGDQASRLIERAAAARRRSENLGASRAQRLARAGAGGATSPPAPAPGQPEPG
jgi:diguanylate cyclase (GGDEF)-like protein